MVATGRALSGPIAARSPVGRAVSGPVGAVLHIRSGPATGGSAQSRGNIPELNAGEILPCAERVPLHMGEHRRKTSDSREPRNNAENPGSVRGGAALRCAIPRDHAVHPDGSASRAPPALAAAVRVRDVVRVREGAISGGDPRIVRNGALGGSFRPAPGDRLDGSAESCGCHRGRPVREGERSSQSARTGPGEGPDRRRLTARAVSALLFPHDCCDVHDPCPAGARPRDASNAHALTAPAVAVAEIRSEPRVAARPAPRRRLPAGPRSNPSQNPALARARPAPAGPPRARRPELRPPT